MEKLKGGLEKAKDNAGITEYVFGTLAFIFVLPVILAYFVSITLIIQPLIALKKRFWK